MENKQTKSLLNLIIYGAPGGGKGTQSSLLIDEYKLKHLSTGDILRNEIAKNTSLGKIANGYISNGELVPDDLVIKIIDSILGNIDFDQYNGIVFDGFPRTVAQAEALEKLFEEHKMTVDVLIDLDTDEEELINRLLLRGKTSGRSDDNLQTIKTRLETYKEQTMPVSKYYKDKNRYTKVQGVGTIDEIFERIKEVIEKIKN